MSMKDIQMSQESIQPKDHPVARLFLEKYRRLVEDTGFYIDSCGCCESPWIAKLTGDDSGPEPLRMDKLTKLETHIVHLANSITAPRT